MSTRGTPSSAVSRWGEGGGTVTRCRYLLDTDRAEAALGEGLPAVTGTLSPFPPREASARLRLRSKLLHRCRRRFQPAPNPNRKCKFSGVAVNYVVVSQSASLLPALDEFTSL